ncbi:MFS transporter [Glycomyces halotolerans]
MNPVKAETASGTETPAPSLWRDADFLKYWLSQAVSRVGVQVAGLALPLAAILMFDASAAQLGVLNAALFAPYLIMSLPAGVWIDRSKKRPMLIAADAGRVLALVVTAGFGLAGLLEVHHLYLIAFAMGVCAVLFDVAGTAYLPSLIGRDRLLDGNGKLQATIVFSKSGGPSIGGVLVELITAPLTLVAGAATSLVSVASLLAIRKPEPEPERPEGKRNILAEIGESLRFIAHDRYLRFLTIRSGVNNLFFIARNTLLPLFVLQTLGFGGTVLGLVLGVGAVGAFLGTLIAKPLAERIGPGRTIVAGFGIASAVQVLLPLAAGPPALALSIVATMFFISGCFMTIGNTNVATLQQVLIPRRLLGRTVAGMRTVTWGSMPVGALFGGLLGSVFSIRTALVVTAVGFCLSALWIAVSPLARMHRMPDPPED